jgi:hypothetical protein
VSAGGTPVPLRSPLSHENGGNESDCDRESPTRTGQIRALDPGTSLSMNYLRAYDWEWHRVPGHKRRAKAARHLLRMHWQHVPGGVR